MFDDIRVEIEDKIKSIDRNIGLLREEVTQLVLQGKSSQSQPSHQHSQEIKDKLDKIEAEMQLLRYQQQLELRTSRARSYDKERKPIFKKDRDHEDFGSLVLGLDSAEKKSSQDEKKGKQCEKILERKELNKPPLPDVVVH